MNMVNMVNMVNLRKDASTRCMPATQEDGKEADKNPFYGVRSAGEVVLCASTPWAESNSIQTRVGSQEAPAAQGRASYTTLNGVSAARRKRVKPAAVTTSRMRFSPDCAPRQSATSCEREQGVHNNVENE